MITSITYEDVNALYEKLRIPFEEPSEKLYDESFFSKKAGDTVTTNRTLPYAEFVDVICTSQQSNDNHARE